MTPPILRRCKALQLILLVVLLVLASTSNKLALAQEDLEGEQQQHVEEQPQHSEEQHAEEQQEHHEPPPPPEDPVPQQEEAPPVEQEQVVTEEAPPVEQDEAVQEEAPPIQEEAPPIQEEAPPVQEEEAPPVQEETPPVQEEAPPVQEEETPPVQEEEEEVTPEEPPVQEEKTGPDDSLFEINVFECMAPRGDPMPKRTTPVSASSIMTLCIRPQHEAEATLKSIAQLDFSAVRGPSQPAVRDNEAAGPMTRALCPMADDEHLCIAATKLDDQFFEKAYAKAKAAGEVVLQVAGEERTVPFEYKFSTDKAPKQAPVEHDFFELPETPPPFPCTSEIRMWLAAALVLTLLEFAFSPDSSEDGKKKSGGSSKKKKSKKE